MEGLPNNLTPKTVIAAKPAVKQVHLPLEKGKPTPEQTQQAKAQAQATAANVVSSAVNLASKMASTGLTNSLVTLGVSLLKEDDDKKKDLKSPPSTKSAPPARASSSSLAEAVRVRIETTFNAAEKVIRDFNEKILEIGSREAKSGKSGLPKSVINKFLQADTASQQAYTAGLGDAATKEILKNLEDMFRGKVDDAEVTAAAKMIALCLGGKLK